MNRLARPQRGFSLIEVMVSLIVIGIGLLGLSGMQVASIKGLNNAHSRTMASILASELGGRMRVNRLGAAGGFYESAVNCNTLQKQCRGNTYCTPAETARFDIQDVMCGVRKGSKRVGGVVNTLPAGTLEIACDGGCATPNVDHNITIEWTESKAHEDLGGEEERSSVSIVVRPN
ncbi:MULTISPECIES: type IV pilus modification protein PilV [Cocleimonas]|uniref:Type IV pilus assembly protein PilV n=1 Tax=Cocleimonas flava TaxID=634765 RepID=A0A4R1F181_9GAMM|nr:MULTISPECIES: type IV pilus modification protein PilV [Cocleimonas]MEB8433621.1 type IV pilus modification protein PilV [Cocleimonas sp. KMM 6892]MEC4716432.1 type IV pilus modification protein PilV [Cocleimonas sp. KMM 6895]MEC4745675.1 type IV pilus modification protein PilV [Cocleimonas sp. KMM 6896]TCJ85268.1 type IV pilus assembly protein PilV [Cocleimonas flava]